MTEVEELRAALAMMREAEALNAVSWGAMRARIKKAERERDEARARVAAMRAVLKPPFALVCSTCRKMHEAWEEVNKADAGRALLDELAKLRAVAEAARTSGVLTRCDCDVRSGCRDALVREALAALDAKEPGR